MADLTQLLYGSTLSFGAITVGQIISASGNFVARNAPQFEDCDNQIRAVRAGRYAYGTLNVAAVAGNGASDLAHILLGSTFSFAAQTLGQVISVGGNLFTRDTPEFSDCDNDAKKVVTGHLTYGAANVSCVYTPTATTGTYAVLAAKAINATPTGAAVFTDQDGTIVTGATAIMTNLDLPSAGSDEDRLVTSCTVQPVNGAAWVVSVATGDYTSLVTKGIDSSPTDEATFTWKDGSKIVGDVAVITSLDFPTAGSSSDRVVYSLSIRPVDGGTWVFTGI